MLQLFRRERLRKRTGKIEFHNVGIKGNFAAYTCKPENKPSDYVAFEGTDRPGFKFSLFDNAGRVFEFNVTKEPDVIHLFKGQFLVKIERMLCDIPITGYRDFHFCHIRLI